MLVLALAPTAARAQLRPLDPLEWAAIDTSASLLVGIGAGVLDDQRASLAGTRGRLVEAGMITAVLAFDRVALELAGTAFRELRDEVAYAAPVPLTEPPDADRTRGDVGDFRVGTIVRLTPRASTVTAVLRFGTRLPTTNNTVGLERDQTDFYGLLGARANFAGVITAAEAGIGVHGLRDPFYEQSDVAIYALQAERARGLVRPVASFLGHFDGLTNGSHRGAEDLKELRAGVKLVRGRWWVRVLGVKGFETYSPSAGLLLTLGLLD